MSVEMSALKERGVVVTSGAQPKFVDFSTSHRGELRANVTRQEFSIYDPDANVVFKSGCSANPAGLSAPRHRHNFEQVRYIVEGEVEYNRKIFGPGWLGYFPEGVYYGPHSGEAHRQVVLQFPGPSGSPFFTREQSREGQRGLRAAGVTFKSGACIWPDGRTQDGWEAMWEFLAGRPIEYPEPRFAEQVWIDTGIFSWQPSGTAGVSVKRLAQFNDCGPALTLIRLEPGASTPAGRTGAMMLRYVVEGEAEYGGQHCPAVSSLYYPPSADYSAMHSRVGATVLSVGIQTLGSEPPVMGRV